LRGAVSIMILGKRYLVSASNHHLSRPSSGGSGSGGTLLCPRPLRTARAPFDACSSSIGRRPCEIRPGAAPPAHDTPSETRSPQWPWGRPERYCGRAGYRDVFGGGRSTGKGPCDPADLSASLPAPVG
jgi:hypothetical protein